MIYELTIVGGGPAGVAAGVYAARKRIKTLLITKDFNGQSTVSENIQNWIGTVSIKGSEFSKNLENHLRAYADNVVAIMTGEKVISISKKKNHFLIETDKGKYESKTVLITSGSHRKKLEGVPGADKFENKGITYCASCDGPLFAGENVAVIGGGNAAFETAAELLAYAKSVTLIARGENFRADPSTVEKILENPKMSVIKNVEIMEIKGEQFVSSILYHIKPEKDTKELPVAGIFVEIGSIPTTDFAKNLIDINNSGHVIIDHKTGRSSLLGIWAAGDCTDGLYHQNNISAGDAVKALEDIYIYLSLGK